MPSVVALKQTSRLVVLKNIAEKFTAQYKLTSVGFANLLPDLKANSNNNMWHSERRWRKSNIVLESCLMRSSLRGKAISNCFNSRCKVSNYSCRGSRMNLRKQLL